VNAHDFSVDPDFARQSSGWKPGTGGSPSTILRVPFSFASASTVANARTISCWCGAPFFVEYDRRFQFPAEETVLVNNSPIDMDFDTDGVFSIEFEKYETWTDMKVRIHMSGFMGTGGETVTITGHVTDQAGVETSIPTIARFYFDNATEHHSFYGERRVGDLPPGRYTLTFEWSVSDHTFRFDERDTVYASITECLPIPTF